MFVMPAARSRSWRGRRRRRRVARGGALLRRLPRVALPPRDPHHQQNDREPLPEVQLHRASPFPPPLYAALATGNRASVSTPATCRSSLKHRIIVAAPTIATSAAARFTRVAHESPGFTYRAMNRIAHAQVTRRSKLDTA